MRDETNYGLSNRKMAEYSRYFWDHIVVPFESITDMLRFGMDVK